MKKKIESRSQKQSGSCGYLGFLVICFWWYILASNYVWGGTQAKNKRTKAYASSATKHLRAVLFSSKETMTLILQLNLLIFESSKRAFSFNYWCIRRQMLRYFSGFMEHVCSKCIWLMSDFVKWQKKLKTYLILKITFVKANISQNSMPESATPNRVFPNHLQKKPFPHFMSHFISRKMDVAGPKRALDSFWIQTSQRGCLAIFLHFFRDSRRVTLA